MCSYAGNKYTTISYVGYILIIRAYIDRAFHRKIVKADLLSITTVWRYAKNLYNSFVIL